MSRLILVGGASDMQRLGVPGEEPPAHVDCGVERYAPVLDHYDRHMRDIAGGWGYRIVVEHRAMPRGTKRRRSSRSPHPRGGILRFGCG